MLSRFVIHPTARSRRWGCFLIASAGLFGSGCAGRFPGVCPNPVDISYSAPVDSLGLASFKELDEAHQLRRRQMAGEYRAAAKRADRADRLLLSLTIAGGLAPDDSQTWLDLAQIWRVVGDDLRTEASLRNALTAASGEPDLSLEVFLSLAWWHYGRAEWREALRWVQRARQIEPGGGRVMRIHGLVKGIMGAQGMARGVADDLRRRNEYTVDSPWVMANLSLALGQPEAAFSEFLDLRPEYYRAHECYRDMARAAERVDRLDDANRWYQESAAALPNRRLVCLTRRSHLRISSRSAKSRALYFWLGQSDHYAAGSVSAYLGYAFERFSGATTASERERWGGLAVNAAGICLRLQMEMADARRLRGLVYAGTGRVPLALSDLQRAQEEFPASHPFQGSLAAMTGHLLLLQKDYVAATQDLRRSLETGPDNALAWADLGLALIMQGDQEDAAAALTQAIDLDNTLAAAWYNRGLMYLRAGDWQRAEADLQRAIILAPSNREISRLLQRLNRQKNAQ